MSKQQGTRLYEAPTGTAWTDLAAGAAPGSPWVQIASIVNVKVTPHEVDKFDKAALEDTAPQPDRELKPGNITFTKDQDATASVALRTRCDAGTKKKYAVVYLDGTADTVEGALSCTNVEANKGDYRAKVPETYQIDGDTVVTRQAAA